MKKKYYYLIIIILIIAVGFLLYKLSFSSNNEVKSSKDVELLVDLNKQKTERKFNKKAVVQLEKIINLEKLQIFTPLQVKCDKFGNVYILDFSAPNIVKLSKNGDLILRFGKGKGKGPGELINPTDFSIDNAGNLWVIDPANGRISVFNNEGSVLNNFSLTKNSYRITVLDNFHYVLIPMNNTRLFLLFYNGKEINSFGEIISNQLRYSIMLSGIMASDNNNNIYFALDRSSLLLSYDSKGNFRFGVKTIENFEPLPKLETFGNNVRRLPSTFTSLSLSIKDNKIYILSRAGFENVEKTSIDIYKSENGLYLNSFIIPKKINSCDISGNNIYAINDTALYIYEIKNVINNFSSINP